MQVKELKAQVGTVTVRKAIYTSVDRPAVRRDMQHKRDYLIPERQGFSLVKFWGYEIKSETAL